MLVTFLPIVTAVRLVQPWNAKSPMLVTLSGTVTLIRLEQSWNAPKPMCATPFPIVMLLRPVQYQNVPAPPPFHKDPSSILVTLLGMVTLVTLVRYWNASPVMLVTGRPSMAPGMVMAPPGPV